MKFFVLGSVARIPSSASTKFQVLVSESLASYEAALLEAWPRIKRWCWAPW